MIANSAPTKATWIHSRLTELTLEQKVGQMIFADFPGTELTPEVVRLLHHCHLGGAILTDSNIVSMAQMSALIQELQRASLANVGLPLFVGIDQEGGSVNHLRAPATVLPSAMAFGATRAAGYAEACARAAALEMRALGINVNFAPVLDVNTEPANPVIGTRSFGDSPELVAKLGTATIRGLRDGGVLATAKHFPGHGFSCVDSHVQLPVIMRSRRLLHSVDLYPFALAIAEGVPLIMSAHAVYPALSRDQLPGTMSSEIMTRLLREEMGFHGLAITDALVMGAIAECWTLAESAVLAVQSGADIVLTLGKVEEQEQVFQRLLRAVQDGEIDASAVDSAVARILAAKWSFARALPPDGTDSATPWSDESMLAEHARLAQEVAQGSITLVKNEAGLLPLRRLGERRLGLIEFAATCFSPVEGEAREDRSLRERLRAKHENLAYLCLEASPTGGNEAVGGIIAESDLLVVATRNAKLIAAQAALVQQILAAGKPTIVVALRGPYDISEFPQASTYLATYGGVGVSLEAVTAVMFGERRPQGKLPVSIPGLYRAGHGLERF